MMPDLDKATGWRSTGLLFFAEPYCFYLRGRYQGLVFKRLFRYRYMTTITGDREYLSVDEAKTAFEAALIDQLDEDLAAMTQEKTCQ